MVRGLGQHDDAIFAGLITTSLFRNVKVKRKLSNEAARKWRAGS